MEAYTSIRLEDAGLDAPEAAAFAELDSMAARIAFLSRCRKERLCALHAEQERLEHLDYLIFMLRKQGIEEAQGFLDIQEGERGKGLR